MPTQPEAPAPAGSSGQGGGRLAALDGLRLVAALLVVFFHYVGTQKSHLWTSHNADAFPGLYQFATYGYLGVQFFFIISGFVICMSSWDRSLRDFFVSRTVRLYPMYWAAIVVSALVVHYSSGIVRAVGVIRAPSSVSDVLLNFTMVQDAFGVPSVDSVYWTLWAELRFYLLFAIVVAIGVTYRRALAFCALWLIAAVVTASTDIGLLQTIFQPAYAPYFIAGILLYLIHRFGSTPLLWGLVGLCWLIAQSGVRGATLYMNGFLGTDMEWLFAAALVTGFFAAVAAVALGWLRWAKWRWLTVAGVLTYPLYLMHQNLGLVMIRSLRDVVPKWPLLLGTVAAMLLAAYLGHRLVERPVAPRLKRLLQASLDLDPRPRVEVRSGGTSAGQTNNLRPPSPR